MKKRKKLKDGDAVLAIKRLLKIEDESRVFISMDLGMGKTTGVWSIPVDYPPVGTVLQIQIGEWWYTVQLQAEGTRSTYAVASEGLTLMVQRNKGKCAYKTHVIRNSAVNVRQAFQHQLTEDDAKLFDRSFGQRKEDLLGD